MTLTLIGWILIVSSIAISALLISPQRSATPDLLTRLRSSSPAILQDFRGSAGILIAAATAFLLVAGIGAAVSYVEPPSEAAASGEPSLSEADSEIAQLDDYARSLGTGKPAVTAAAGKLLPDVNTMIERLAARLEAAPEDVNGWRMLGWSYFNTERYDEAAKAYAKAVELDPASDELRRAYDAAKAKIAGQGKSEATPLHMSEAQIRSMVDGLAFRLESSPREVDGWARLMRSRVVLGEREVAATDFRKALDVFKDDAEASARITAEAIQLGLKAK